MATKKGNNDKKGNAKKLGVAVVKGKTVKATDVYETTDYDSLKPFPFNRDINTNRTDLLESMEKWGFTSCAIVVEIDFIDGVPTKYILDGHNRMYYAKIVGVPFCYKLVKGFETMSEVIKYMASLNSTSKNWRANDYINIWANSGKPAYKILKAGIEITKFSASTVLDAYGDFNKKDSNFKDGKLTIPNRAEGDLILNQLMDLKKYVKGVNPRRGLMAVMRDSNYDHEYMKIKLEETWRIDKNLIPKHELDIKTEFRTLLKKRMA